MCPLLISLYGILFVNVMYSIISFQYAHAIRYRVFKNVGSLDPCYNMPAVYIPGTAALNPKSQGRISIVAVVYIAISNAVPPILGAAIVLILEPGKIRTFCHNQEQVLLVLAEIENCVSIL